MFGGGSDQERQSFEGKGAVSPEALLRQSLGLGTNLGNALSARMANGVSLPSAYVQQPGAYTGGGLPMPIGVVASDPALTNPSLLSRPPLSGFTDLFKDLQNFGSGGGFPSTPGVGQNPGAPPQPGTPPGYPTSGVPPGTIPPINYVDPDGPLGGDYGLDPGAFDNFFLPDFGGGGGTTTGGDNPGDGRNTPERVGGPRRRSSTDYNFANATDPGDDLLGGDDLTKGMGAVQLLLESMQQQGI